MRRTHLALLALLIACTSEGEPAETTPTTGGDTVTTGTEANPTTTGTVTGPAPPSTTTTAATTTSTLPLDETVITYEPVATGLDFPTQLTARDGEGLSYVITKEGRIWWLADGELGEALDITDMVRNRGEQGLLSLALHPEDRGLLYLHYSDNSGDTVVSEWALVDDRSVDAASERILLQVGQPASNHNGGMIQFLPDGRLLLGLGDGGGAGDRYGNGQNRDTLLGGLVAIDPATGDTELYAIGLRNPWRFWIDGDLVYVADVGQNAYEEVSVASLEPGHNFGWPVMEGLHCYQSSGCETEGFVEPVLEVAHGDAGTCSISGGPVYRGALLPQLNGHYFYSDYCGGYLRSFRYEEGEATELRDWTDQVGVPGRVPGFGVDGNGELYVLTVEQVLRVVPGG